jgi:hypothetical protein
MIWSPRGSFHGSWVEPWKGWISFPEPVPGDGFGEEFPSSAGPFRLVALVFPYAEALGNLCSVKTPFRGSFPKAFPSTAPKGGFRKGVGDGHKGQIRCCSKRYVRTEVLTSLTYRLKFRKNLPEKMFPESPLMRRKSHSDPDNMDRWNARSEEHTLNSRH